MTKAMFRKYDYFPLSSKQVIAIGEIGRHNNIEAIGPGKFHGEAGVVYRHRDKSVDYKRYIKFLNADGVQTCLINDHDGSLYCAAISSFAS